MSGPETTTMQAVGRLVAALVLVAGLAGPTAAYHEKNEPSDGTVKSFKPVNPPRLLPDFTFHDGDGRPVRLSDLRGRVVLVNLWATWCAPCIRELPALDRLQGKLGGDSFMVLALSLDQGGAMAVVPFFERLKIENLGVYVDPIRAAQAAFPTDVLPASFMVDRQGRATSFLRSYADWDAPEAEEMIRRHLAAPGE